jgi:hypothetical protein
MRYFRPIAWSNVFIIIALRAGSSLSACVRVPINEEGNYLLCADAAQSRILKGPARQLFNFDI